MVRGNIDCSLLFNYKLCLHSTHHPGGGEGGRMWGWDAIARCGNGIRRVRKYSTAVIKQIKQNYRIRLIWFNSFVFGNGCFRTLFYCCSSTNSIYWYCCRSHRPLHSHSFESFTCTRAHFGVGRLCPGCLYHRNKPLFSNPKPFSPGFHFMRFSFESNDGTPHTHPQVIHLCLHLGRRDR